MSIFYKLGVENKDAIAIQCDGVEMSLKVWFNVLNVYLACEAAIDI